MRLYNNLVQRCFNDCVDDFRSKNLSDGEEKVLWGQRFVQFVGCLHAAVSPAAAVKLCALSCCRAEGRSLLLS
jgi:hypothetical protein